MLAEFWFGKYAYVQSLQVGRLEGLDILLGMDWLTTYGVTIDCAKNYIKVRGTHIQFG